MFSFGSKSSSFSLVVAITASLMGANVYSFTEVSGESNSGWVDVLSDPYYEEDIEECNSAGTSTEWCFKDWNCPTEEGHCLGLANEPGVTITNSKTLDNFPFFFDGQKIAYTGILQGCSANLECSAGYSDTVGLNIPVSKLLEFSEQYPPEIAIGVSKLNLGGLGTRHGILTDLWFIDEESKVLLVIDIYWQRSEPLLLSPVVVLEEDWSGSKYKVYHYWEEPKCLENNSEQYQSCSLSISDLLTNASNADYRISRCIKLECGTNDFVKKASFDYSKFILQDIDSGIELLWSPWGEATATITYTQLRFWSLYNEGSQSETAISVRMERAAYSADDDIVVTGKVNPVIPAAQVEIRVTDPTGNLARKDFAKVGSDGEFLYTFPAGRSAMKLNGEYEVIAMYEDVTDSTIFNYNNSKSDDEGKPLRLQISSLTVIHPTGGAALTQLEAGEAVVISTTVRNPQTVSQSYILVTQITDENSITVVVILEPGIVGAESTVNLQLPWSADSPGAYKIQVMMVDDLESPSLLSESMSLIVPVS